MKSKWGRYKEKQELEPWNEQSMYKWGGLKRRRRPAGGAGGEGRSGFRLYVQLDLMKMFGAQGDAVLSQVCVCLCVCGWGIETSTSCFVTSDGTDLPTFEQSWRVFDMRVLPIPFDVLHSEKKSYLSARQLWNMGLLSQLVLRLNDCSLFGSESDLFVSHLLKSEKIETYSNIFLFSRSENGFGSTLK